jgi:outer membrane immunogenic protein
MKRIVLALTAVAALTGSALAADLPARTYSKAPVIVPPAYSWTGFYIFGGGGYGMWNADEYANTFPGGLQTTSTQRYGGSGYFGTVGAGYDWQFNGSWVAGVFGDGQFGSLKGTMQNDFLGVSGTEKLRDSYAAGVRIGYLVAPNVYSYVNGGYSGSQWSGSTLFDDVSGNQRRITASFNRNGWFVGGGVENSIGMLGAGWFMKTEYRAAEYSRVNVQQFFNDGVTPTGFGVSFKPWVQTVSTSLVYRFNWTGPVVAKY